MHATARSALRLAPKPFNNRRHFGLEAAGDEDVERAGAVRRSVLKVVRNAGRDAQESASGRVDVPIAYEKGHGPFDHVEQRDAFGTLA